MKDILMLALSRWQPRSVLSVTTHFGIQSLWHFRWSPRLQRQALVVAPAVRNAVQTGQ
jgi:hypothetical protein